MGDNNIIRGTVASREGDRLVVDDGRIKASVRAPGDDRRVGAAAAVSVRAAAVELDGGSPDGVNQADCEIIFVEYLGDLVKLHLSAGGERMLAKVPGDLYVSLRGREGDTVRVTWKEEDVRLLGA
jgi:putative spermidine/putrescine transport system ATP-binding protein